MTEPPSVPSPDPPQWRQYVDMDIALRDIRDRCLKYPGDRRFAPFNGDKFGISCLRCHLVKQLGVCPNCGDQDYQFGLNADEIVGLFCVACRKGFTSRTCECGCENPVTYETLFIKNAPQTRGCLVVTAATGGVGSWEVAYLSRFRDEVLARSMAGRAGVRCYYAASPIAAALITRFQVLRPFVLRAIIRPTIVIISLTRSYTRGTKCYKRHYS